MTSALLSAAPDLQTGEWFADWFDSPHYHQLYAGRDATEAAAFIDTLVTRLRPAPGAEAVDLGCGAGRHARQLAARGLRVTGLDLSAASIRQARAWETPALRFRRHDMRVPFGRRHFDYVFSFFTSFGYFETAAEHVRVMRNMAQALKPGGTLVLDYLNHLPAARRLVPDETKTLGGTVYRLTRWADACAFYKRIRFDEASGGTREYVERVARFGLDDFRRLCARSGLQVVETYGDYDLSAYDAETSPRLILLARKPVTPSALAQPSHPAARPTSAADAERSIRCTMIP